MKTIQLLILGLMMTTSLIAQQPKTWTETDREYLLKELIRSRDEVVKETANLSSKQWNFKESPDRWSINQIIEHINIWELLLQREITQALAAGPQPALSLNARADSIGLNFIYEDKPHIAIEHTKPFTWSVPLGLNEGKNNVALFLKMRNESIEYVKNTKDDLRAHFLKPGRGNIHQVYISTFGHTDRHVRQVKKVKGDKKWNPDVR